MLFNGIMHPEQGIFYKMISPAQSSQFSWSRTLCILITVCFLGTFLLLPLLVVFSEALRDGLGAYFAAINDSEAQSAIRLTLITAAIAVPMNVLFGLCAAWLLTKFNFRGKSILLTLIDIPFAVPPVIAGFLFILLLGTHGMFAPWLKVLDMQIIFSGTAVVLVSLFITFPFVARELIPLMQEQGIEEEQAALSLGASGFQTFWRVTLPNIKWALVYGAILCNARAMGEFGAVSVVSGHIRGKTNTMPLHIEILYNEYNFSAAFAVASLLVFLALITLALKNILEWRIRKERASSIEASSPGEGISP